MSRHRAPVPVRVYQCEHLAVVHDGHGSVRRIPGAVAAVHGSEDAARWVLERVRNVAEQVMKTPAQVEAYMRDVREAYPVEPAQALAEGGQLDLEVEDPDGARHEITVRLPVDAPAPVRLPRHRAAA